MKTIVLLISGALISLSLFGQRDKVTDYKKRNNYFYFSPGELFFNTFQLGYERKLRDHNTLIFLAGFKLSKKDDIINRIGGNGEIQYRINLLYNKEMIGLISSNYSTFAYFAPFIQYRYEDITDPVSPETFPYYNTTIVNSTFGGLGFGFRLTALENRFCVNFFAGGGLKYSEVEGLRKYSEFFEVGYTGITPKLSFQMGIAF